MFQLHHHWFPEKNDSNDRKKLPLLWRWLHLLTPFYQAGFHLKKQFSRSKRVEKPVICIGNMTLGGNGKTPLVALIASHMQAFGLSPHILTRGYGGKIKHSTLVTEAHTAADVGDEPLLLAKCAPTWVGSDRYRSAQAAITAQADVLLMDDGFQNFSLHKDLSLLLMDARTSWGNGAIFPAGPLRESWQSACQRADALFIIDEGSTTDTLVQAMTQQQKPIFFAQRYLHIPNSLRDQVCIAFSGLGGPSSRFYQSLVQEGLKDNICATYSFPDHHIYTEKQAQTLLDDAKRARATLVTTQKDHVRLASAPQGSARHALYQTAIPIAMGLEMDSWDEFEIFITQGIQPT